MSTILLRSAKGRLAFFLGHDEQMRWQHRVALFGRCTFASSVIKLGRPGVADPVCEREVPLYSYTAWCSRRGDFRPGLLASSSPSACLAPVCAYFHMFPGFGTRAARVYPSKLRFLSMWLVGPCFIVVCCNPHAGGYEFILT